MSKIEVGDEVAFRYEYSSNTEVGFVKGIKRFLFWKIYLIQDDYTKYHLINTLEYFIVPTGEKEEEEDE